LNRIILILSLICYRTLFAQSISESINYINYNIKDGLPSNETYDVFQDSKGFIWIGTDNGVVKYNGKEFKTYTTQDGLTDNTVFRIKEDYKGRIWFMTYSRRLCFYNDGKIHHFEYNDQLVNGTKEIATNNTITDLIFNNDTLVLYLVDLSEIKITNSGKIIKDIFKHKFVKEDNYAYSRFDIFEYKNIDSIKTWVNEQIKTIPEISKIILGNRKFGKLHLFPTKSQIIVGSQNGLTIQFRDSFKSKTILTRFNVSGFTYDFEGGIWCSTTSNGIFYIPSPNLTHYNLPKSANSLVHGIVPQNEDIYFIYNPTINSVSDRKYKYDNSNGNIEKSNSILEFKKTLNHPPPKFENSINLNGIVTSTYSYAQIDSNRNLISTNTAGLLIIEKNQLREYPQFKSSFYINYERKHFLDPFKNLWLRNNQKNSYVLESDSGITNRWLQDFYFKTYKIYMDYDSIIWMGTLNGLFQFNRATEIPQNAPSIHPFTKYRIQDILQTKDSTLFFATKANGIFVLKDGIVNNINEDSGLLSNTINQLIYDSLNNQVWAGSNNGISVLNQKSSHHWKPKSIITKFDGLELIDIRQLIFHDNSLFFAHNEGIGKIHKEHLDNSLPPPLLYIQSLYSNENQKAFDSSIIFSYDENNIQINYHAISYKSQNDITYKYQLLPLNENWQTTINDNVIFNALPPNEYTLNIKAINMGGIVSEVKTLKFSIVPAFWMTWWFKIIVIIIAVIIGYKISIKTIQTYKSQAQFQRTLNEMQIVSLQSKMNPQFIFNSLN
jgi:ligand-binding sensor domain-containing protein